MPSAARLWSCERVVRYFVCHSIRLSFVERGRQSQSDKFRVVAPALFRNDPCSARSVLYVRFLGGFSCSSNIILHHRTHRHRALLCPLGNVAFLSHAVPSTTWRESAECMTRTLLLVNDLQTPHAWRVRAAGAVRHALRNSVARYDVARRRRRWVASRDVDMPLFCYPAANSVNQTPHDAALCFTASLVLIVQPSPP